ncbi:MAG: hypothetical protein NZM12_08235, partial [Steroidobacteraceae bacterium]|nr:hypothetical protein [Steroidobacteraceae bacterium]MDW8258134.1 hypothetical protein [Gammaproteobacteria bacterium]
MSRSASCRWASWVVGCALACAAADILPPERNDLPTAEELERLGARIGAIYIVAAPIFATDDPRENNPLYRAANRLHVDTRESAIRAQLLFASGQRFEQRLLDETARNLRRLRYVREPQIRPIAWHDGVVDIEVRTQDVWTLNPGLSFGRSGGANKTGAEFEDLNFLGRGKHASVGYIDGPDGSSVLLRWRDPNILGTRWSSDLAFEDRDRGSDWAAQIAKPFVSLQSRSSVGLTIGAGEHVARRYRLGQLRDEYRAAHRDADLTAGWSKGLQAGWVRRWYAGLRVEEDEFAAMPG